MRFIILLIIFTSLYVGFRALDDAAKSFLKLEHNRQEKIYLGQK
jgi:hypothetical protein